MKKWTVIWQPDDADDYEYSYVECDEPFDFMNQQLIDGVQNTNYDFSGDVADYIKNDHANIICVLEGHIGVNFP
jgi:hypothetical protein